MIILKEDLDMYGYCLESSYKSDKNMLQFCVYS